MAAATPYSFRVCGQDGPRTGAFACAQTRTFTTLAAVDDAVMGSWTFSPHFTGEIEAHSGPAGQNPRGFIRDVYGPTTFSAFVGFVSCLVADGDRAAIGAIGQETLGDSSTRPATVLYTVEDGGPSTEDTLGRLLAPGSTPPDCFAAEFNEHLPTGTTRLVVNDAP